MKCLCGSGKFAQNCHGFDVTKEKMRSLIKYDVLKINPEKEKIWINANFKPLGFTNRTFKCLLKYWMTITPAGLIIYPLLLMKNDRAIRPITIDGLYFDKSNGVVTQYVQCMLTPVSRGTIVFQTNGIKFGKNGYVRTECHLTCEGNPFESVYALETNDSAIKLYHHTSKANASLIHNSSVLKGSRWNLQGTQEVTHNHFIYLTDIETIQDVFDLIQIGMADKGTELHLSTDDGNVVESFTVYREETANRDSTVIVWVDPEIISPPHLILHEPSHFSGANFSWWEVFHSSIFRIPIKSNSHSPLKHIKDNEYSLDINTSLITIEGFNAGHGMDMISMKRILSESVPANHPHKHSPTNADMGNLDPRWSQTWDKNLSALSVSMLMQVLNKEIP